MIVHDHREIRTATDDILLALRHGCEKTPGRYHFNPPASSKSIAVLEKRLKFKLPISYKLFLLSFNGGFICDKEAGGEEGMSLEDAAWNSNFLHGLGDIEAAFGRKTGRWKKKTVWT